ncbi:unnamed protein product [Penicillium nalgiovense]|uniref:Uncharacterized protein n=1 Tax=Penicillium nalgiovense TaxID=60175 RepID=A0A9W4IT60_PENNA|nr:unnamed protein product [Penicillium nalgiovense]CAG7962362.1 unnamed protein product [Penicillium nalgiovense]CAG7968014.1 unnamed protein product [Penicillium nalgiovense]CAG7972754.1 unnamed protein product [Penicillium nalgiovense]CAG8019040.1 unnamed protein product [Penicillium nalgiovense]
MLSQPARRFTPAVMSFQSARAPLSRRTFTSTQAIFNSTQKPSAYKEGMNQYRTFTSPFAKVFLGGVFVYQVLYWTWLKLEMDEIKVAKNSKTKEN